MKAILKTILILLCAASTHADPIIDPVNQIGFIDVPIQNGMNLMGTPFVEFGSTNVNITDLLDESDLIAGTDPSCADSIWILENNTYTLYYLSTLDPNTWSAKTCWVNSTTFEEDSLVLNPGDAFWLDKKGSAGDITVRGEVISEAQISITFEEGKNLFSYPYSVSKMINDIDNSAMTAGYSIENSDSIQVWNNDGYDTYFLYAYGGPEFNERVWVTETLLETNFELTIGKGYWFNAINQTTVTFTKPY